MPLLRPIEPADHAFVLDLNQRNVELLAPMDEIRLEQLLGWASQAAVIEHDGQAAGFVLVVGPGTAYDSANYRWHADRYGEDFVYLDRIVLADGARRHGLGSRVYDAIELGAADQTRVCLEVNLQPPNEPSLAFHARRGYAQVGRLGDPGKVVALLAKPV